MTFKIVIPSKDRINILCDKTLNFLIKSNLFYKSHIYIFVNRNNFQIYKSFFKPNIFDNITIVLGGNGLNKQRNCIRNYFPDNERLLILDDDLIDIQSKNPINNLHENINEMFDFMEENNIKLGSINPTNNVYYSTNDKLIGLYFCVGCFYLEINNKNEYLYLDIFSTSEKEDYIRTIKHYNLFGGVLRYNNYCVNHKYGKTMGGMNYIGNDRINDNKEMIEKINVKYPNLCVIKKTSRKKEISFRTNDKLFKKLLLDKKFNIQNGSFIDSCNIKCNNRNYKFYDKETGDLIGILLRNVFDDRPYNARHLHKLIKYGNSNRGNIAGKITYERLPNFIKIKTNKELSNFVFTNKEKTRGYIESATNKYQICNNVKSITLGNSYFRGRCLKNKLTKDNEEFIKSNFKDFLNQVSNLYKRYVPYNVEINNKWLDTEFSGITCNKSVRSGVHCDVNNIGWSCIYKYKCNDDNLDELEEGENLLFPEYDLDINLTNKDLLLFDSSRVKHANPKFKINGEYYETYDNSNIISLVFFKSKFFQK